MPIKFYNNTASFSPVLNEVLNNSIDKCIMLYAYSHFILYYHKEVHATEMFPGAATVLPYVVISR